MVERISEGDLAEQLATLADHEPFEVGFDRPEAEVTSDRVDVDTPAGRVAFEVDASEDHGADHEDHDPDEDVYVNCFFLEGYAFVRTQRGVGEDATNVIEVHEQRPEERALELRAHGVPERRAEVVALREQGLTYSEIVEATGGRGPNYRGDVSKHLQKFNRQVHNARWLAENADVVSPGRTWSDDEE